MAAWTSRFCLALSLLSFSQSKLSSGHYYHDDRAVLSSLASSLQFSRPVQIGHELDGWSDSDNFMRFDDTTILGTTSKGVFVSEDDGESFVQTNLTGVSVMFHAGPGLLHSLSVSIPKSREGFNFSADHYVEVSRSGGKLQAETKAGNISYVGLPTLVTCHQGLPTDGCCGCPFRVSSHGSDNVVRLLDGGLLQTINVFFETHDKEQGPSSVVCYRSVDDGLTWHFQALIANASDFPHSEEGPNESALVRVADGKTLLAIMRMDGGDGPPHRRHTVMYQSTSEDEGKTWTHATPLTANLASVRPKVLMMNANGPGKGPLLVTTGRPGIFLWVSWDGMAHEWEQYNIAEKHNAMLPAGDTANRYTDEVVNGTVYFSPYQSSVYNSLVAGRKDDEALIFYNRRSIPSAKSPPAVYAMKLTVTASQHRADNAAN